jgi:DNA-directed RNA polymerase sigma subunit (sigma70/sigma32)
MEDELLNSIREKEAEETSCDSSEKEMQEYVVNILEKMKDERIKRVFKLRYFADFNKKNTWVEIGKMMKVSPQTAINLHNRGQLMIAKKINSKLFADIV